MQVSIIGFGRFGQLLAKLMRDHHGADLDLAVASRSDRSGAARDLGLRWVDAETAAGGDVVVLCVPIRELDSVVQHIRPHVRPGALVMDTCSVKVYPARLLERSFPATVDLLATHPMFGPTSVEQFGIAGQTVVLCPIRLAQARLAMVAGWFGAMGVQTLRTTPEEHDRQAAISQGLVHFVGRAVAGAGFQEPAISTSNSRRLFELARSVVADSPELFHDLETFNPFAADARAAFLQAAQEIDSRLR